MARKQKRRGAKQKPQFRPAPPTVSSSAAAAPPAPRPGGRIGGDQALVRSVEMSLGQGAKMGGRGRGRYVLESGDPGIPLDRVPHFISDLRRIGIVGGLMVVLLLLSAYIIIPQVLK